MRRFIISIIMLLIGGAIGYKAGSFGPKFADGMHKTYGIEIDRKDIVDVLQSQAAAWNRGDIDGFMEDYLKSENLRFASGGTIALGWETAKARYEARYPDKAAMGRLGFTDLEVTPLSKADALVFGRWQLIRENDAPNGLFTLHFKNVNGQWVIVSDHTSSGD